MSDNQPERKSFIRRAFGGLWSLIVNLYRGVIIISFLFSIYLIWSALTGGGSKKVENNVALVLWPSGALVDQLDSDPGQRLLEQFNGEPPSQTRLGDLVEAIEAAADDSRIPLAVLKLDNLTAASMPQLEELGAAKNKFLDKGRTNYAHGRSDDQRG